MANEYVTVDDLFNIIQLDPEKYGSLMQFMLDTAASHIQNIGGRSKDGYIADTLASTRLYTGSGKGYQKIDECVEVTLVEFKYHMDNASFTSMASTDWFAYTGSEQYPEFNDLPYTKLMISQNGSYANFPSVNLSQTFWRTDRGYQDENINKVAQPNIRVTAKWGYGVIAPSVIKHCIILQATRWIERAKSAYSDVIGSNELGQLRYVKMMDVDIKAMLFQGGLHKVQLGKK